MTIWLVAQAELRRHLRLARSYPVDFVTEQLLYILGFFLLSGLLGLIASGTYSKADQLSLLVGFLAWRVADGTMLLLSATVANDAEWGTLEQLWLCPLQVHEVFLGRAVAALVYHSIRAFIIAVVAVLFLRLTPQLTPGTLLIFLLTQVSAVGLAFVIVALQLVYKQISAVTLAVSTALLFVTGALAPLPEATLLYGAARFLPLTAGIALLHDLLVIGDSLRDAVLRPEFLWLVSVSVFYGVVGVLTLSWGQREARRQGTLAHY